MFSIFQPRFFQSACSCRKNLWYNNNATPSIPSLVKICDAFQITLSEFFAKAEGNESAPVVLTPQQMQVIDRWSVLRPDQQEAVLSLLNTIP